MLMEEAWYNVRCYHQSLIITRDLVSKRALRVILKRKSNKIYELCFLVTIRITAQKMNIPIKDFFSKFNQIRRKLQIWSHLLKKSLMENLICCEANYLLWQETFFGLISVTNNIQNEKTPHISEKVIGNISKQHSGTFSGLESSSQRRSNLEKFSSFESSCLPLLSFKKQLSTHKIITSVIAIFELKFLYSKWNSTSFQFPKIIRQFLQTFLCKFVNQLSCLGCHSAD